MKELSRKWHIENPDRVRENGLKQIKKRCKILCSNPVYLNEKFHNSEGHHICDIIVIDIPKEIHKSISHSLINNKRGKMSKNMDDINLEAWIWLAKEEYLQTFK
jgi:hypothetical protein